MNHSVYSTINRAINTSMADRYDGTKTFVYFLIKPFCMGYLILTHTFPA